MRKYHGISSFFGIIAGIISITTCSILQLICLPESASAFMFDLQNEITVSDRIYDHCVEEDIYMTGPNKGHLANVVKFLGNPPQLHYVDGNPDERRLHEECRGYADRAAQYFMQRMENCIANSGAPLVEDITTKCNICVARETSTDSDWHGETEVEKWYGYYGGTGWLASKEQPSNPVINLTGKTGQVEVALFSRQYSCANTESPGGPLYQWYTWFGADGNYGNPVTGLAENQLTWLTIDYSKAAINNPLSVYIGTMPGHSPWSWSGGGLGVGGAGVIPALLDISGFREYAKGREACKSVGSNTLSCEVVVTTNSCAARTIVPDNQYKWGEVIAVGGIPGECGGNPTVLQVIVDDDDDDDDDDDKKPCNPDKEICGGSGDAEFTSTTTVHVDASREAHETYYDSASGTWKNSKINESGPDNLSNWKPLEATSPIDGNATIRFSTDQYETTITFWHRLIYSGYISSDSDESADDQSTSWASDCTVPEGIVGACVPDKRTGSWNGVGKGGSDSNSATANENIGYTKVTVQLNPGQTKTVCRRIDYTPKYVNYKEKTRTCGKDESGPCYYDPSRYGVEKTGGSGSSYACAIVSRPYEPEGNGPDSSGTANSTIMFAGETADISWDVFAKQNSTARLAEYRALVYRVPPQRDIDNLNPNGTILETGDARYRGADPCDYLKGVMQYSNNTCQIIARRQKTLNFGAREATHLEYDGGQEESIAVPNNVGAKYCNTFAYKYEFWYAYSFSDKEYNMSEPEDENDDWDPDEEEEEDDDSGDPWDDGMDEPQEPGDWHKIPGQDYWNIYGSACRTIAKKPTVAIWNGSMLTSGGIKASKAYRYNSSDLMGKTVEHIRSERSLYSSWVEYLGVVGGTVSTTGSAGFTTGAATAIGSGRNGSSICAAELTRTNSPLTVANTECGNLSSGLSNTLGNSGITNNSTYRVRLQTYLENHADRTLDSSDTITVRVGETDRRYYTLNNLDTSRMAGTTIIKVPGNLRITKNILTDNTHPYSSIYDLPQVILFVNGNVEISSDVTEIDAWIVASGSIDSCYEFVSTQTESDANNSYMSNTCTKQLVFNAPVMASSLDLHRSYGADVITTDRRGTFNHLGSVGSSDAQKYNAAEVFNFRADVYLWSYAQAGRYDSSYTETYSRELAPRY